VIVRLAVLLGVLAGSLIPAAVAEAQTNAVTFTFTGREQVFEVPDWVASVEVTATGAAGAASALAGVAGGRGATVSGTVRCAAGPGSACRRVVGEAAVERLDQLVG
jgi:hypothetical protein